MEEKEIGHGDKVAHVEGGQPLASNSEYNLAGEHDQLQRGLKSRHIQFLALGMALERC